GRGTPAEPVGAHGAGRLGVLLLAHRPAAAADEAGRARDGHGREPQRDAAGEGSRATALVSRVRAARRATDSAPHRRVSPRGAAVWALGGGAGQPLPGGGSAGP